MNIVAQISEHDIDNVVHAINGDLVSNLLKIVPEATTKGGKPQMLGSYSNTRAESSLKTTLNSLVQMAFKEGCKAGKGGLAPY